MKDSPFRRKIMAYMEPAIYAFGLKQRWNLFAPDLTRMNQYSTCLITFEDGSLRLYEWPRVEKMSVFDKLIHQKLRRFVVEFWARPKNKHYWPDSAYYFIQVNSDSANPPRRVEFLFNYTDIPEFANYTKRKDLSNTYIKDTVFNIPSKRLNREN